MVMPAVDLNGKKFGYLTVVERAGTANGNRALWLLECVCGTRVLRQSQSLRSSHRGKLKSCGCRHGETVSAGVGGHLMTGSRPWVIWQQMRKRCRDPESKDYSNYGGRGIDMPDAWYRSFAVFWEDVKEGYSHVLTIDRKNNDKGYSKENYRWVTPKVQQRNKRTNRLVNTPWGRITVAEASERSGVRYITVYKRALRGLSGAALVANAKLTTCSIADPAIALLCAVATDV